MCGEVVVGAKFGMEEGFAVVPKTIDTMEEGGFVDGERGVGFGIEELEEEGCDFVLEGAEFGEGDGRAGCGIGSGLGF